MKTTKLFYLSLVLFLIFISCEKDKTFDLGNYNNLDNLPVDTGGFQSAHYLDEELAPYGYYMYTPSAHDKHEAKYPLLVFLHGSGEKGNSLKDPSALEKVLKNGPTKMIKQGTWNPSYPMLVVSPQCHDGGWNASKLHDFISVIAKEYKVNTDRIYLTGLSMGGFGTWKYIQAYADSGHVVAAVPICGGGNKNKADAFRNIPIWAFHGDADHVVNKSGSIEMVEAINSLDPLPKFHAKLTMYSEVGHNSWSMTYTGSGIGQGREDFDPFNETIYDWFFQYKKEF